MSFNECLLKRRKEKGISQEELAEKMGVSRQAISKWETGETMPDASKLMTLSDVLEISLDELCGKEINPVVETKKPFSKRIKIIGSIFIIVLAAIIGIGCFFWGQKSGEKLKENEVVSIPNNFEAKASILKIDYGWAIDTTYVAVVPNFHNKDISYKMILKRDRTLEEYVSDAPYENGTCTGKFIDVKSGYYSVILNVSNGKEEYNVAVGTLHLEDRHIIWADEEVEIAEEEIW